MTAAHMDALRRLYGRPAAGTTPLKIAAPMEPARLLHHRRVSGAVLAAISDSGTVRLLRISTADDPQLTRLGDADRATISAAVLALAREGGPQDAA